MCPVLTLKSRFSLFISGAGKCIWRLTDLTDAGLEENLVDTRCLSVSVINAEEADKNKKRSNDKTLTWKAETNVDYFPVADVRSTNVYNSVSDL